MTIHGVIAVHHFEEMTSDEYEALPRDRTFVVLPISPLEVHGPFAPYGADAFIAKDLAERLSQKLMESEKGWGALMLPLIYAGSDTQDYPGSVEVPPTVIKGLVKAYAKRFKKDGFTRIMVVSAHAGPRYMVALEEVAASISRGFGPTRMVCATASHIPNVITRELIPELAKRLAARGCPLSAEEERGLKTDYHAGAVETAFTMLARPELVKENYKRMKPAIVANPMSMRRSSSRTVPPGLGYVGSPHLARREMAEEILGIFLEREVPKLRAFLTSGKRMNSQFRSMYYWLPPFWPVTPKLLLVAALLLMKWYLTSKAPLPNP